MSPERVGGASRIADAVIVAAGGSSRMGGIDKLAEPLLGRPLLAWSVAAMRAAETIDRIVVVAREEQMKALANAEWLGSATLVPGGAARSDSVRAGVEAAHADVVLVHDGARPLASSRLADAVARAAAEHGAAVPALAVTDSLKVVDGNRVARSVERERLVGTQTPQAARRDLLISAFARAAGRTFTDEAALLEASGVPVVTVPGESTNIKVTVPDDLPLARALAAQRADAQGAGSRIGFGQDTHGFGPGNGLRLGGIEIADAPRLHGHSDGDVVLHAVATALLSACGLGDLGRLFPSSDPSTAGVDSTRLVADVVDRARESGWLVERAQVSIVGARPRLGVKLDDMAGAVAQSLEVDRGNVSIVASTGNLYGPEGAGLVISASAFVTVVPR